jgi:[acyl-carrier-protein] S-malonyltransferase
MAEACAFLFPGQGAQFVGMGLDFAETFPAARAVFDRANEIVGFDLAGLCFSGPEADLTSTANSQPAIYTVSFAVLEALRAEGRLAAFDCRAAAGLSLGEFTALAFAGAMSFEDGLRLVQKRGRFMQAAGEARPGTMAAVIGADEATLAAICAEVADRGTVAVANLNTPDQIVLSGEPAAVEAAGRTALERGARGVVPLKVSAAFHSPLMRPAREALAAELARIDLMTPRVPVLANVTAQPHGGPDQVRAALTDQIDHPVRWWPSMRRLLDQGLQSFVEIGPGRVLAGMLKRIDRGATCTSIGSVAALRG